MSTEDEKHDHHHEHDESCDHGDEGDDIVVLEDADGNEVEHVWLGLVEVDGEQYALLTPSDELEEDSETTNVYVFHYSEDEDGGEIYQAVEDDALLARVQAEAEKMFAAEDDA